MGVEATQHDLSLTKYLQDRKLIEHMYEATAMSYYCRSCAHKRGLLNVSARLDITGNNYLRDKFKKHTVAPTAGANSMSIFDDGTPQNYSGLMTSGLHSGWVEVDSKNRSSLVWDANKRIGETYSPSGPRIDSALRIPYYDNSSKCHGYTTASREISNARCADCGKLYRP